MLNPIYIYVCHAIACPANSHTHTQVTKQMLFVRVWGPHAILILITLVEGALLLALYQPICLFYTNNWKRKGKLPCVWNSTLSTEGRFLDSSYPSCDGSKQIMRIDPAHIERRQLHYMAIHLNIRTQTGAGDSYHRHKYSGLDLVIREKSRVYINKYK